MGHYLSIKSNSLNACHIDSLLDACYKLLDGVTRVDVIVSLEYISFDGHDDQWV